MLAIAGIKANKMRSLLTMLGIIIGISSVIGIVSIGNVITSKVTDTMASFGTNNIQAGVVERVDDENGNLYSYKEPEDYDLLTMEQIDSVKEKFPDRISDVSVSESVGSGKAENKFLHANVNTIGVNAGYKEVNNVTMKSGRFISDNDIKGSRNVAVVSDEFAKKIFNSDKNALGKEVKIDSAGSITTYSIIGTYEYKTSIFSGVMVTESQSSTDLYTPVTVVKASSKNKNYTYFTAKAKNNVDQEKLTKDMKKYLQNFYKTNKGWTVNAMSMQSQISMTTSMFDTISLAISVIAGISLLVGGIGVMNIMLVSVTERTREIGTRKALGAKSGYIKMQFITEAVIICLIGGTIGIILGIGLGVITALVLKSPISISISTILISFTFSMAIGVFFGYYPAKKASNLDPIEALRYE